jgi:signal transduction histidine kinase
MTAFVSDGVRASVLLVDDNEGRRYAKKRLLRAADFDIIEAETGAEGLHAARDRRPRLAIVDIGLPDMSGQEVCRRLKADPQTSMPVLQVSATFVSEADTVNSLDSGADACLVEPIDPQVFIATVRALLRARQAEDTMRDALVHEQEARRTAEDANRIKDEFLAVLSHELRSPLGAVLTWSSLLKMGMVDRARHERGLAAIERNARVLSRLIEDLLDVSRIISGKTVLEIGLVEVASTIDAAMESMRAAAEAKGIHMEAVVDPTVGPLHADPTRLQQVIWNLLSNAVKFTPRGGTVRVEVHESDSQATIRVTDTGRGIPAPFLPHVFERFRQADSSTTRAEGGLGLGLAIVRHIVELHGGSVRAESPGDGLGASFTVTLPLPAVRMIPDRRGMREKLRPVELERLDHLRVLVVDDDGDAREAISAMLEARGGTVTTADSVAAAVQVLERGSFDVMVSDIGMPGEDGYALIRRVRNGRPSGGRVLPAVALTAYANASEVQRIHDSGFDVALTKPVDPKELIAEVARLARSDVGTATTDGV